MKYMKRIETFNFERKSENEHRRSIIRIGNASYSGDRPFRDTVSFGSACAYTALLGLGICLIGDTVKGNNKVNRDIRLENAKTDNRIRYENACAENTMRIDNNRKKNKIEEMEARLKYSKFNSQLRPSRGIVTNVCSVNPSKWISDFEAKFPTPDFSKIPVLGKIISGCPDGYKVPMALHLLTAMGAICFSRVRSVYIDGRKHGPNLLLIVEGESGSGKSYFASIYKDLFLEVIEEDRIKYANGGANTIISTAGIDISAPKFAELLANNKDVHNFIMETEFSTVEKVFSRNSSLDSEILRKAFDNEQYYRNRFGKDQSNGIFNVFMNCSFTGTPQAINRFFNENEVEGGTARRFCFSIIPESGRELPDFKFPQDKELKEIREKIRSWRHTYCFNHDNEKGDNPCSEYVVDLDYVKKALKVWLSGQYDLYEHDGIKERKEHRNSIAAIAFHYAIVLHMLLVDFNNKKSNKDKVVEITLYIANYCMERYITKFSSSAAVEPNNIEAQHTVECPAAISKTVIPDEVLESCLNRRGTTGENGKPIGLGTMAKELGIKKYELKNALGRYKKNKR